MKYIRVRTNFIITTQNNKKSSRLLTDTIYRDMRVFQYRPKPELTRFTVNARVRFYQTVREPRWSYGAPHWTRVPRVVHPSFRA